VGEASIPQVLAIEWNLVCAFGKVSQETIVWREWQRFHVAGGEACHRQHVPGGRLPDERRRRGSREENTRLRVSTSPTVRTRWLD